MMFSITNPSQLPPATGRPSEACSKVPQSEEVVTNDRLSRRSPLRCLASGFGLTLLRQQTIRAHQQKVHHADRDSARLIAGVIPIGSRPSLTR